MRTGPPCSGGSGFPSCSHTIHALPPVTCSSGRLVVYPVTLQATTCVAVGRTPTSANRSSTLTPVNEVPSFDHVVTQWMSPSYVERGTWWISSQVHVRAFSTSPSSRSDQSFASSRGLTSAVRTGKEAPASYWPGGSRVSRSPTPSSRRNVLGDMGPPDVAER